VRAAVFLTGLFAVVSAGCTGPRAEPNLVWGKRGVQDGELVRPRAAALDQQGRLYIVDFTARIQVFDLDGHYLGPTWQTPDYRNGRPSGLSIDRDGNLLLCDSHYNCLRVYSPHGELLRTIGGQPGVLPGQFGYLSDAVQDADGYYYVAEFGETQRISKLDAEGRFVHAWGSPGDGPGQFSRVRALALGPDGLLYAADACNNRIQVFTKDGDLVRMWGEVGTEPGQLRYPYDLDFDRWGNLYVVEYGNCRVQKFTPTGKLLGCWGGPGRMPGQLDYPWALVVDRHGNVHVLDTNNHRVQRFRL
jgi:sugar lactone lactonase YvrE